MYFFHIWVKEGWAFLFIGWMLVNTFLCLKDTLRPEPNERGGIKFVVWQLGAPILLLGKPCVNAMFGWSNGSKRKGGMLLVGLLVACYRDIRVEPCSTMYPRIYTPFPNFRWVRSTAPRYTANWCLDVARWAKMGQNGLN